MRSLLDLLGISRTNKKCYGCAYNIGKGMCCYESIWLKGRIRSTIPFNSKDCCAASNSDFSALSENVQRRINNLKIVFK